MMRAKFIFYYFLDIYMFRQEDRRGGVADYSTENCGIICNDVDIFSHPFSTDKTVYDEGYAAVEPLASMQAINNPELGSIAGQIRDKLKKVIAAL